MDNLTISNNICSREEWLKKAVLPEELKRKIIAAEVLIVPSMMVAQPRAFMVGTMDLLSYLQSQLGDRVEICISDDDYEEIELNSKILRLGEFVVASIALPLFLNVLGNYIYEIINEPEPLKIETVVPEYQQPATVSFTIAVEDSLGKERGFHYEGPASDYKEVAAEIERLWNEE